MIRLKDIASFAGVSVMTVSKALRDEKDISVATKNRIRQIARETGYVPNSAARGLRVKSTRQFGLIISALTNPLHTRVMMAIEEQSHEMGYEVIFAQTLNNAEREERVIRRMLARRVDGLFIRPVYRHDPSAAIYDELRRQHVPTVILGHRALFCSEFPNVQTNDLAAATEATQHLIDLGHRRIACFTGPIFAPWAQERWEGYRRAMLAANLELDDRLVFHAGSTIEEGEAAALQMIQESAEATAIIAANDLVAFGIANVLLDQGLRIPQDISLVGFGNVLNAKHFRVPLTTVRQPKYRRGIAAMETMMALLAGKLVESKILTAELVLRKSTGPVPAARPSN
ncbi:MAG: LacI family transcriptional regulator [Pedosphaera sp.]|nr:LacI family transcriptional regulator [Pedosphaera sp.]MSU43732.1 LacI family transcriptional regulator [Pedosphaera sp.]